MYSLTLRHFLILLNGPDTWPFLVEMSRTGFGNAWFITIGGSEAAFGFGYVVHNQFYYRFTAFRLNYLSSISAGEVLTNWIVRDACSERLSSFDFSHGEAWFEQFWANECYLVYRMAAGRGFMGHLMSVSYLCCLAIREK